MDQVQARACLAEFPDAVVSGEGTAIIVAVPPAQWVSFASFAKQTLGCSYFSFLSAVDWKEEGLEVIAWVDNLDSRFSVLMRSRLGAGVTACGSIVPVYRGAGWMEREAFDMFGIRFEGHPDLRRIRGLGGASAAEVVRRRHAVPAVSLARRHGRRPPTARHEGTRLRRSRAADHEHGAAAPFCARGVPRHPDA